jgi:hypothetical protein
MLVGYPQNVSYPTLTEEFLATISGTSDESLTYEQLSQRSDAT